MPLSWRTRHWTRLQHAPPASADAYHHGRFGSPHWFRRLLPRTICRCLHSVFLTQQKRVTPARMIAGYRSALAAWYVAGSLLLRCCCRCYSFGNHALFSRTATSPKNIRRSGVGQGPTAAPEGSALCEAVSVAASVRRIRTPLGAVGEDVREAAEAAGAALVLSRPIVRVVLPAGRGLRVHSMSDLHTDSSANAAW